MGFMEKIINTLHICDKRPKPQIISNQNTHPKKHVKNLKLQMVSKNMVDLISLNQYGILKVKNFHPTLIISRA